MSKETRFLSRLLGLYCVIIATAMLAQRESTTATVAALLHDAPLMYVVGVCCVFAGLAMTLVHNVWSRGLPALLVTLIGWLTLLKGIVFVGLQPAGSSALAELYMEQLRYQHLYPVYACLTLALGAYLCYAGFTGRSGKLA